MRALDVLVRPAQRERAVPRQERVGADGRQPADRAGDVKAWSLELLRRRHVAVAPGTTFGAGGEGWVRVSLATETAELLEGLARLSAGA